MNKHTFPATFLIKMFDCFSIIKKLFFTSDKFIKELFFSLRLNYL